MPARNLALQVVIIGVCERIIVNDLQKVNSSSGTCCVPIVVSSSQQCHSARHLPDRPSGQVFDASSAPESTKRIIRSQSDRPIYDKSDNLLKLTTTDRGASPVPPSSPGIVQRVGSAGLLASAITLAFSDDRSLSLNIT